MPSLVKDIGDIKSVNPFRESELCREPLPDTESLKCWLRRSNQDIDKKRPWIPGVLD